MLSARNIIKRYGNIEVLGGVDLDIHSSEVVALVGKSGSGKSTLLQILGTLDPPDSGTILFDGQNLLKLKDNQLAKFRNISLGFVFQFHHLLVEFTALENVCMPAFIRGDNRTKAETKAKELLDYLGLTQRLHHRPAQLSGGEQQRVAVARALMNEPRLILADEPTGNLDTLNGSAMFNLFLRLAQERQVSFLVATHNEDIAKEAIRCVRLEEGLLTEVNAA